MSYSLAPTLPLSSPYTVIPKFALLSLRSLTMSAKPAKKKSKAKINTTGINTAVYTFWSSGGTPFHAFPHAGMTIASSCTKKQMTKMVIMARANIVCKIPVAERLMDAIGWLRFAIFLVRCWEIFVTYLETRVDEVEDFLKQLARGESGEKER